MTVAPAIGIESQPHAPSTQRPNSDYADLKRQIVAAGLLAPQQRYYTLKGAAALATLAVAVTTVVLAPNAWLLMLSAVFLAFASTQAALLGHDIAHRQGFRGRRTNGIALPIVANLITGISHSWWTGSHNAHHAHPNHIDRDPDVQFPMVVFDHEQIASKRSGMRRLIGAQAVIFPMLFPLQALNMKVTTTKHLLSGTADRPWLQAGLLALHLVGYGVLLWTIGSWPLALAFFFVHQLTFGFYNSSVFASNHKGMAMVNDASRMDFLREQVLTARNVTGPKWVDFWYGGLNYQIEHHLFPTMPRNNLHRARPIVKEFCRERGVAYHEAGLLDSYAEGIRHLHRVSEAART